METPAFDPVRIYLVGFMGCGKSTIGPVLAKVLGFSFFDLDFEIVREAGTTIPDIFREYGEEAFRTMETSALRKVSRRNKIVVSLGGGAMGQSENVRFVLNTGVVVHLQMDVATAVLRLKRRHDRPMLWGADGKMLDGDALGARVRMLMETRSPDYEKAHITIPTSDRAIGKTVDRVATAVRSWLAHH